jgi:hypothetical protein
VIQSRIDEADRKRLAVGRKRELHLASLETAADIGFAAAIERDAQDRRGVALSVRPRDVFKMQDAPLRLAVELEAHALAPVQKIHEERPALPGRFHATQRAAGFLKPLGFRAEALEMHLQLTIKRRRPVKLLPHLVKRSCIHPDLPLAPTVSDDARSIES